MQRCGPWFAPFILVIVLAGPAVASPVAATIDAARTGPPITPLVFGGFMEPATTRVWAEMLSDRKFFNGVTPQPDPAAVTGGFGRRGRQPRWLPVGPDESVVMDETNAFVGEWSPSVRLDAATPHGISQSGLALRAGRTYTGRVALAGSPGARVSFAYADLKVPEKIAAGDPLQVEAQVGNTGTREGDEVAQVYLTFPRLTGAPRRALRGFTRVHLKPGDQQTVRFTLKDRESHVSPDGMHLVRTGRYGISVGGGQPGTGAQVVAGAFEIQGERTLPR